MNVPEYKHEREFQKELKKLLDNKEGVVDVKIKTRGADLVVWFDECLINPRLHERNKNIVLSNPFFIETKLLKNRSMRNVLQGIKQCYDKYSLRTLDENNRTCFLTTPEAIFLDLKKPKITKRNTNFFYKPNPEPVFFPNKHTDLTKYFNRICWVFKIGVMGGTKPTTFMLNDFDKFNLSRGKTNVQ